MKAPVLVYFWDLPVNPLRTVKPLAKDLSTSKFFPFLHLKLSKMQRNSYRRSSPGYRQISGNDGWWLVSK